jgi:hypothetical protein
MVMPVRVRPPAPFDCSWRKAPKIDPVDRFSQSNDSFEGARFAVLRNETGSGLLDRYAAACHKSIQRERHSTNG